MSELATETAKPDIRFSIAVIYNGVTKSVTVNENEVIQAVLQHAIQEFGSLPSPHTLALFTEAGVELQDTVYVKDAGITKDTTLLLRPSQVKGGVS
jgi:hypothetical protein